MIDSSHDLATILAQSMPPLWAYKVPGLVFAFCFGACVGSFLNVVVYRLPAGISIISPPSRCPTCGARLSWHENLPILGWLLLRGRCRSCGEPISPQYMVIELLMALIFLGFALLYYVVPPSVDGWGEVGGPWWFFNGAVRTLPAFVAILVLLASLTAMTLIDARTFTIPLEIPLFATITAFLLHACQALLPVTPRGGQEWAIPLADPTWCLVAALGMAGLLFSIILLRRGKLRMSFSDYDQYLKPGEALADYPHARREMGVELLFLLPCIILMVGGYLVIKPLGIVSIPLLAQVVGSCMVGYIVAGGLVWAVRILGTLGFGREAMGMGDVHLLAAVGVALGWRDPIFIFFGAAFVGLAWVLLTLILLPIFKKIQRQLPYGPHLAVATLVVLLLRPLIYPALWEYLHRAFVP